MAGRKPDGFSRFRQDGGDASFEFPDGQTGLVKDVRYAGDGSVTYLHGDAKGSARIDTGTLLIVK